MAQQAGERMDGLYGLAGLGACESFSELESMASEAGVPNAGKVARELRRRHSCACKRLQDALPIAVNVKNMLDDTTGSGRTSVRGQLGALSYARGMAIREYLEGSTGSALANPLTDVWNGGMAGLGAASAAKLLKKAQKAATKTAAKIAKVEAKEAKQEAKVAAKVAKLTAAGKTAKAAKVVAKDAKQDAKVAAKLVKLGNQLTAAQQAVATATQATTAEGQPVLPASASTTPTETAAAVLANQAQVQVTTPAAQQLMQEVVANAAQPGSTLPTSSLSTPGSAQFAIPYPQSSGGSQYTDSAQPMAENGGGIFENVSPVMLAGAGVLALLVLPKLLRKRS